MYYSYSNFIELNRALYTIIKPEKIIVNNIEIDVVNADLDESLFEDIKCNYIDELTSINILNSYQRFPKITDGAGIATLNIFHKEYGYTLGKHLITLAKMEMPQKFGKLYLEYDSQITKEELLKNDYVYFFNSNMLFVEEISKVIGKQGQNIRLASWLSGFEIDVYREKQADDDVELTEFDDEIEAWIIAEFKKVGLETAKSVLDKDTEALVNMTDLEEETIEEVKRILKAEFED